MEVLNSRLMQLDFYLNRVTVAVENKVMDVGIVIGKETRPKAALRQLQQCREE